MHISNFYDGSRHDFRTLWESRNSNSINFLGIRRRLASSWGVDRSKVGFEFGFGFGISDPETFPYTLPEKMK